MYPYNTGEIIIVNNSLFLQTPVGSDTFNFPSQCSTQTCTKSAVDLQSMFLRSSSSSTGVVRRCSIPSHIPDDSPYSCLQTSLCITNDNIYSPKTHYRYHSNRTINTKGNLTKLECGQCHRNNNIFHYRPK